MTPYKGIVRITCTREKCDQYKAIARAAPLLEPAAECINCEKAAVEILGLEGDVIARQVMNVEHRTRHRRASTCPPPADRTSNIE